MTHENISFSQYKAIFRKGNSPVFSCSKDDNQTEKGNVSCHQLCFTSLKEVPGICHHFAAQCQCLVRKAQCRQPDQQDEDTAWDFCITQWDGLGFWNIRSTGKVGVFYGILYLLCLSLLGSSARPVLQQYDAVRSSGV